jgi:hypothetical protein
LPRESTSASDSDSDLQDYHVKHSDDALSKASEAGPPPPGLRKPLDEDACRKRLTLYEAHTIRKFVPRDLKEKATWAKSEITREPLSQEDISKAVKRLNESKQSVKDKKHALKPFQQGQVNRLLEELMTREHDQNFEWSLSQLDSETFINKKGQKETSTITVYVKRAPLKDLNPIGLFNAIERGIERNKYQRMEQLNKPPSLREPAKERLNDPDQASAPKGRRLEREQRELGAQRELL